MRKTYGAGYPDTLSALLTWSDRNVSAPPVTDAAVTLTRGAFQNRVLRVAGGLRNAGVGAGARVALWLPNAPTIWPRSLLAPGLARWPSTSTRAFAKPRSAAFYAERAQ